MKSESNADIRSKKPTQTTARPANRLATDAMERGHSLGRTLFDMTWPMLFGVVALMGYQLVDSIFISMLGTAPLAALGFTVAVNQLFIGVQIGLGIAATALISRAIGANESARARNLGGLVLIAGSSVMAALCVAAWVGRDLILSLLDADPDLWPLIGRYWLPWLFSIWLGAVLYFAYSIARAQGNSRLPGTVMVVTSLLNVVLDPIFIFVFDWGLPGAALATAAAFAVGGVVMWHQLRQRRWVRYSRRALPIGPAVRDLGAISGPAMLSQLMPGLAAMIATTIVAGFGATAVAAWALVSRLEFFSIVIVLALTMSLPPMVGRLYGAKDLATVDQLVRMAVRFVLVLQAGIGVLWLFLSFLMPPALTDDPVVAAYLRTWLAFVPFSFGALGTCMIMVSTANALGLPLRAVAISALRLFACYLPALWVGAMLAAMSGVFIGIFIGNLAAGIIAWALYRQAIRRAAPSRTPDDMHAT